MKKLFLFAAVAGLGLVSASPPDADKEPGAREARGGYPPCSASVTDRCIQLRERGVRTRANLARNRELGSRRTETASASDHRAAPAAGRYPPCSATVKDECQQRRALARRIRMAGERG